MREAGSDGKLMYAGDVTSAPGREYPLALSEAEVARYQLMAEQARVAESDLWQRAGIVAGAQVADVGCGPGALLPALSDAVAPTGHVTALDAYPAAVAAAGALVIAAGLANVTVRQRSSRQERAAGRVMRRGDASPRAGAQRGRRG